MQIAAREGVGALTEKEKQTLRLMVRGHDAKSIARRQGLSVHTINERLRDARRKLAVSSSRQAARVLLESEGDDGFRLDPDLHGDKIFRDDAAGPAADQSVAPDGAGAALGRSRTMIGVAVMTLVLGLLAVSMLSQGATTPSPAPPVQAATVDAAVVATARQWLALLDQSRWAETYQGTGAAFRRLNTLEGWTTASQQARAPLGAVVSRSFVSQQHLPAPPAGYEVVKFRTSFANRPEATETVTLEREDGAWLIVGIIIE